MNMEREFSAAAAASTYLSLSIGTVCMCELHKSGYHVVVVSCFGYISKYHFNVITLIFKDPFSHKHTHELLTYRSIGRFPFRFLW